MTYLVTGATGFIGSKLVAALLGRGDAIYYLARKRSPKLPSQASFHPWDTGRKPDLNALSRIDAVFNLAGEPIAQRWSDEVKKRIYSSRVEGTRNLVSAIAGLQHKPSVLISASAIGYYGDRGDEILTESDGPGSDFLATVCKDWEAETKRARECGVRALAVRTATVLGAGGGALEAMTAPFRFGLGGKFGSGRQWMSWIHVEDLVRLFLFAADNAAVTEAVNGSSPQPVKNAEYTHALARALHRPAIFTVPEFALRLLLGELASFLFASTRVVPQAAERAGFVFRFPGLDLALAQILQKK